MFTAHWVTSLIVGCAVFVPLLVIAIVRFRSLALAFAASAAFSIGAMLGFFLGVIAASLVIPRHLDSDWNLVFTCIFVGASSIGGAAFALWLLRKLAGGTRWERR
jgi:hypothetical protein